MSVCVWQGWRVAVTLIYPLPQASSFYREAHTLRGVSDCGAQRSRLALLADLSL